MRHVEIAYALGRWCQQNGVWPREVTGWNPARERDKFTPYCPIRNLGADYPPILMIHGTADTDVTVETSKRWPRRWRPAS